jgi:membrane glycosyltransferase
LIRGPVFDVELGIILFFLMLAMTFAPKLATLADVLARRDLRRAYGGAARIALGAPLEIVFSMLLAPVIAVAVTLFLLSLPFGRRGGWTAQRRDAQHVTLADAARKLWPQTLAGTTLVAWFWHAAPGLIWYWLPILAGLVGSVPFAVVTAHPAIGRALAACGICRIPEEASPAPGRALAPYRAASLKAAE